MRGQLANTGSARRLIGGLVVMLVLGVLHAAPAFAEDDDDDGDGDHRHRHGYWEQPAPVAPPVIYYGYAPPPVYYAPPAPPVYYAPAAPPVVYGSPSFNLTVPLSFR